MVERFFVFTEVLPVFLFEPRSITRNPDARVTSRRCASEFLIPAANHSIKIKRAIPQIPVASPHNLDALVREVSIKVRYRSFQCTRCFFHGKGFGNHPQAEFLALQSSLAVRDQCFEEICFRFVEETKVRAPRHVADNVDSRLSHLGVHGITSQICPWDSCQKRLRLRPTDLQNRSGESAVVTATARIEGSTAPWRTSPASRRP